MKPITLYDFVMAHRYLYYVRAAPVISDRDYDIIERAAMLAIGKDPFPMPSSDCEGDYTDDQKQLAERLAK